jgi:hypothetical protein
MDDISGIFCLFLFRITIKIIGMNAMLYSIDKA